jgi:hypothetical protein
MMKEREGEVMKERAGELNKKVALCFEIVGSSFLAIDKLSSCNINNCCFELCKTVAFKSNVRFFVRI